MRFSIFAIASAIAATTALAAPVMLSKRDTASDLNTLNYGLTLEYLEDEFYKWGLDRYDSHAFEAAGYDSNVRERLVHIGEHESVHIDVLKRIIKSLHGTPVPKCIYKFPLDDVHAFIAIARALENTGVSAYLGATAGLKGHLLTGAASIATVKAHHSSILNKILGRTGAPYAFDTPLTQKEVITIASNFIESCPFDLGVTPFKQLTAELPSKGYDKVEVSYKGEDTTAQTWCQFLYGNKVTVSRRSECRLPKGVNGYVYVVITDTATPITLKDDSHILAGPALLFY
ncbi:hypothetical protein BGZ65_010544, partial [Modicella reniformis]